MWQSPHLLGLACSRLPVTVGFHEPFYFLLAHVHIGCSYVLLWADDTYSPGKSLYCLFLLLRRHLPVISNYSGLCASEGKTGERIFQGHGPRKPCHLFNCDSGCHPYAALAGAKCCVVYHCKAFHSGLGVVRYENRLGSELVIGYHKFHSITSSSLFPFLSQTCQIL